MKNTSGLYQVGGNGDWHKKPKSDSKKSFWADAKKAISDSIESLGESKSSSSTRRYVRAAKIVALWVKACDVARKSLGTSKFRHKSRRAHNIYSAMPMEAKLAVRCADADDFDSAYVVVEISKSGEVSYSRSPGVVIVVRREGEDGEWIG